jgi:hypothetical protein
MSVSATCAGNCTCSSLVWIAISKRMNERKNFLFSFYISHITLGRRWHCRVYSGISSMTRIPHPHHPIYQPQRSDHRGNNFFTWLFSICFFMNISTVWLAFNRLHRAGVWVQVSLNTACKRFEYGVIVSVKETSWDWAFHRGCIIMQQLGIIHENVVPGR